MKNFGVCRAMVAAAIVTFASTTQAGDTARTIDVITIMPATNILGWAPHRFAEEVTTLTAGSLTLQVKRLDEVGSSLPEIFDQVDAGTQKMFAAPPVAFWIKGQRPPFGILLVSGIPFGFAADEYLAWYYEAGGQQLIQDIFDRNSIHANVIVLPLAVTSTEPPASSSTRSPMIRTRSTPPASPTGSTISAVK